MLAVLGTDSSLEGTGFELPVRECDESGFAIAVAAREELKVCRLPAGGDWIRTSSTRAREVGCRAPTAAKLNGSTKPLSMRIGDLRSARTPHQGRRARTSLCSTVGPRTAPRAPFHRSRGRARYRYFEGSRSGPAVTACQHYFDCSFSRDVMRQSSRAVLRQRSKRV